MTSTPISRLRSTGVRPGLVPPLIDRDLAIVYPLLVSISCLNALFRSAPWKSGLFRAPWQHVTALPRWLMTAWRLRAKPLNRAAPLMSAARNRVFYAVHEPFSAITLQPGRAPMRPSSLVCVGHLWVAELSGIRLGSRLESGRLLSCSDVTLYEAGLHNRSRNRARNRVHSRIWPSRDYRRRQRARRRSHLF